jgi:electron transport complex protein RnfC
MKLTISQGKIVFPSLKKEVGFPNSKIEKAPLPKVAVIPLSQHQGAPAVPLVREGDRVLVGTKIAEADGEFSAAVHSSVSGTVRRIGLAPHPLAGEDWAVEIESDGRDALDPQIRPRETDAMSREEMLEAVRDCGVAGLGGAGVPTHMKLGACRTAKIRNVILNGMESEPYLNSDGASMMERPNDLIQGAKLIARLVGAEHAFLAVGTDKLEVLETVNSRLFSLKENFMIALSLPSRYPQGDERQLVKEILSQEIPAGRDAASAGALVLNVSTALAVHDALRLAKPVYERVVTVTGECLAQPRVLLARIGTPFEDLVRACRGFLRQPGRLVMGGPMTGIAQGNLACPVIKTTTALIAIPPEEISRDEAAPCIRCGYCVDACPVSLNPCLITLASEAERFDLAREFGVEHCVPCGNCSYVCPSKRPMLDLINIAKAALAEGVSPVA